MTSTFETSIPITPQIDAALEELKALILSEYPQATFSVSQGEDPEGIYLDVTIDADDLGPVTDLFIDRLVDMQVEEGLPVFVIPERTPERSRAIVEEEIALGIRWVPG